MLGTTHHHNRKHQVIKGDVLGKENDKNRRISILDVEVDETNFVLVNLNSETKQLITFLDLGKMLEAIKDLYQRHTVLDGDFNFFFDTSLDSYGGKQSLKSESTARNV